MKTLSKVIIYLTLLFLIQEIPAASETKKQRIISLTPATTEILFSLGLNEEIIGVTTFCDWPPSALKKEKVGTFSYPDVEKIIFLKPDIIFATGLEQAPIVAKLRNLNLKVCISDPSDFKELFSSILDIGSLTNREKEAFALVNKMKKQITRIDKITKLIPQGKKPKVYIEIWHDPIMSAGKGSFIDELINLAGGINIAHNTPRAFSYFSTEQIIKSNPDFIIVGYMDNDKNNGSLKGRLGWKDIKAVKNDRIISDINPDIFLRPGTRLTEALEEIYKRIHNP